MQDQLTDEENNALTQIKEQIEAGRYEVDPVAVAEAMLIRLRGLSQARQERVSPLEREAAERGRQRRLEQQRHVAGRPVHRAWRLCRRGAEHGWGRHAGAEFVIITGSRGEL